MKLPPFYKNPHSVRREKAAVGCGATSVVVPEDDVARLGGFDDGQGFQVHPGGPEAVAAPLEALLHGAADADQRGPGVLHDLAQSPHGLAVGHEVVDDQDPVVRGEPVLGHQQGDPLFIGIGIDVALIEAALDVVALGLLGEDHGLVEVAGHDGGKGDAAGLRGEDHGDIVHVEELPKFLGDVIHQLRVDAVVQKAVHLDDVAGQHLALFHDAVFQLLHEKLPPYLLIPVSCGCGNGASIIFNLSSSNEIVGKDSYRRNLVSIESAKTISGYVYTSSGIMESTSDLVFGGASLIYENGKLLKSNKRFEIESNLIYADIDVKRLINERCRNSSFAGSLYDGDYRVVEVNVSDKIKSLDRTYKMYPFIPTTDKEKRFEEILEIQSSALARRIIHLNNTKCVIGMSGGLDSTLAFLVIVRAFRKLGRDNKDIIGVTMPGFGTTDRTYINAINLVKEYGATLKEVSIKEASLLHMRDIGLDESDRSVTYENIQARERTQILMDIANMVGGIVIGTGDLSELALGWCTYNGDHMSMYSVNSSIPKTLVRHLVGYVKDNSSDERKKILTDILDTPISPELLPPDKAGNILQKTESSIGPYVLHDFFLYHLLRYGASFKKIYFLAKITFKDSFESDEIKKWLKVFVRRFYTQQFKRNAVPDGVKVGTISLSPRGDLRMPSEASYERILEELDKM